MMTPESAMVLTGKQALDYSGGVSAEDNFGIGGQERIMGPNGQAQYRRPTSRAPARCCCDTTSTPTWRPASASRAAPTTTDPSDRDVRPSPHELPGTDLETVGQIFCPGDQPRAQEAV